MNGNSIPYTIGDQQIHSDFIRLGDVASTPFAKDPPSSSENQLRKYMYILIALLVFVVLIVSVIVVNRVKLNQCRSDATKAVQDFLRRAELFVRPGMTQSEGPGQNNAGHNLHQQTGTQEENVWTSKCARIPQLSIRSIDKIKTGTLIQEPRLNH